ILVVGAAVVLKDIISSTTAPTRQVARISLVPDAPPPPPPPPPKQERPEEPKEQKQVQEAPKQEAPQPSEQLKMEGPGSDSGLAGLQAGPVLREYKGDISAPAYVSYGGLVQREIQQYLQKAPKLRGVDYRVTVRIWIAPTGEVTRVEIAGSTGSGDVDEVLKSSLAELPALKERPPADMPLPIRLRLTSRT
ncbi:MAG: TonB family protein, partial [Rhodocyclales bacterium]|nr:TonB family protein [Rhodocyclales bacterium]